MSYCVLYNGKHFLFNEREGKLRLRSSVPEVGFHQIVDKHGNFYPNVYVKEVTEKDVDLAYELIIRVEYKGKEFEPFAIGKQVLDKNKITLFTNDYDLMKQYGFYKKEQFVFIKEVPLDEIDLLLEIQKPILGFSGKQNIVNRIEKRDIVNYIKNMPE